MATDICCPGAAQLDLIWTPCLTDEPLPAIMGYGGTLKRARGEQCSFAQLVWTTNVWTPDEAPGLGDLVTIGLNDWFVDSVTHIGCTVVMQLCRPLMECPDCQASIFRFTRGVPTEEDCQAALIEALIAENVGTEICVRREEKVVIDNAEIVKLTAKVCLDSVEDFEPGDLVVCGTDAWRIERILSPCSSKCLLTIEAIREPWHLHIEPEEEP